NDNTATVMGSAVAALLIGGAGTIVLRRRHNGRSNG
ncbi:LPXTG cell wall anchor domain-containing protein, partial [Streptomyces sp. OR43]